MTETIIGRWFAQGNLRRERVVLVTKVYEPVNDPDKPNDIKGLCTKSGGSWKHLCNGCRPTTSICATCTTSTAARRGTKSGKRSNGKSGAAKWTTSAPATSPDGIWPKPRRRRRPGISWASPVNSTNTACSTVGLKWKSFRQRGTLASAWCAGDRWTADCSG